MSPDLVSAALSLPGTLRFLKSIGRDLKAGISLFILYPAIMDAVGLKQSIRDYLEMEAYLKIDRLDISGQNGEAFSLLRKEYPTLGTYPYLEKAVMDSNLPDVILVEGLEECAEKTQLNWVKTMERWAEGCRSSGSMHCLAFLVAADKMDLSQLPEKDVRLAYRVWAGMPSALEVRMLCRDYYEETNAENQWREYLLASLSGNDLLLCEKLWDVVQKNEMDVFGALKQHGIELGWNEGNIQKRYQGWRPRSPGTELKLSPKEHTFHLLSAGFTVYTPEYGEEIHPSALAVMNRVDDLRHRLWRAQAALILPLIDDFRHRICSIMTARHGQKWIPPDMANLMELGELNSIFYGLSNASWEKKQWGKGIEKTLDIRNKLAHYTPITFNEFYQFWLLNQSVHNMLYEIN